MDSGMHKYMNMIDKPTGTVMLGLSNTMILVIANINEKGNKIRYRNVTIHAHHFVLIRSLSRQNKDPIFSLNRRFYK